MKEVKLFNAFLFVNIIMVTFIMNPVFAVDKKDTEIKLFKVLDLKCEYSANPVGLDIQSPQFSWRIESEKRGIIQSAYRLIVSDSPENLAKNIANVWDTDSVLSSESTGISYGGTSLKSRARYYWKIRIWDSENNISDWSEPAYFEMGLMDQEDWTADWIGFAPGMTGRVFYFKATFNITKSVQTARAYISGIGYYVLNINGARVGDQQLDPATSDYRKRIYYTTHDVASYLKNENTVVVAVGPGWYGIPKLRIQLEINYSDGTLEKITSNSVRKMAIGPIIRSSIYDGEYYDAREESQELDFTIPPDAEHAKTMKWVHPQIADDPGGKMVSQKLEPIKIIATLISQNIKEPQPGIFVIDAGQILRVGHR